MANEVFANTGTETTKNWGVKIGPLMQGQAGAVISFAVYALNGDAVTLTGRTVAGTITNTATDETAALQGALALSESVTNVFTWTTHAEDIGTAGNFKLVFSTGEDLIILPVHLPIIATPAASTTFGAALVGVTVAEAAWLATALATLPDAADLANVPDPAGATASYVWTADGADGADWAAAAGGGASDVGDLTTTTGNSTEMVRVAAPGGLEYRTTAQVLSDIGAATAQAITAGTVVSRDGKKVTYNTQGVITAVATMDYGDLVRSTQPWALLGYWPLNETSGVVATNGALSGSGFNGAYEGPTLNSTPGPAGLGNAPLFDGSNDYVNVDSASMDAALSFDEFTIIAWFKVAVIGDWTDGTFKKVWELVSSSSEEMSYDFSNVNNTIRQRNLIGGSSFAPTYLVSSPTTNWYFAAARHSLSQSFRDAWLNSVRIGTTATVLAATGTSVGTWRFGDYRTGGNPWHGYLAHCAVWRGALTTAELLALSKATPFT